MTETCYRQRLGCAMKKVKGGSNSEKAEQPEQANYEKR
jgi:hypothetical protein